MVVDGRYQTDLRVLKEARTGLSFKRSARSEVSGVL